MVKIFTSGSFFDPREVPPAFLDDVAALFAGKVVIAETRTEYVAEDVLTSFRENLEAGGNAAALYVAMGLETTNDYIRDKCIRKGHTFDDFKDAVETARRADVGIKTYLMMKPPYLTEREALADMKKSIREVIPPYSDIISMNLCTIQTRTEVEQYWKQGSYRPPYLWSALMRCSPPTTMCSVTRLAEANGGGDPPTTAANVTMKLWMRLMSTTVRETRFT